MEADFKDTKSMHENLYRMRYFFGNTWDKLFSQKIESMNYDEYEWPRLPDQTRLAWAAIDV